MHNAQIRLPKEPRLIFGSVNGNLQVGLIFLVFFFLDFFPDQPGSPKIVIFGFLTTPEISSLALLAVQMPCNIIWIKLKFPRLFLCCKKNSKYHHFPSFCAKKGVIDEDPGIPQHFAPSGVFYFWIFSWWDTKIFNTKNFRYLHFQVCPSGEK